MGWNLRDLCPSPDSFYSVDVEFNLFKLDHFPNPACSTSAQRAMLVNGEGGEPQAGEAVQGQGSLKTSMSHLMYAFEMSCGSTSLGRETELRYAIQYKEEDLAPRNVQLK